MAKGILLSLLIIAIGVAWLLMTMNVIPGVDWIWTVSLAAAGVITLAWTRLNKITFLMGFFLIIGSVFSILRQTNVLSVDKEVPMLVIVFGLLFLIAQMPFIPLPQVVAELKQEAEKQNAKIP
jgi:hypothetical protein